MNGEKDTIVKLDDMTVKNLPIKNKEYTRREKGGFGVRVLPSGSKILFYLYRVDGKRKFFNLGTYKDISHPNGITLKSARAAFEIEQSKVKALKEGRSDGADPVENKKTEKIRRILQDYENRTSPSVSGLVSDYLERHAKRFKKSWQDDERMLNKEFVGRYGKLKAEHIKKADILKMLEEIIDRGSPASANQCLKMVRKLFNWSIEQDILAFSPCLSIKMPAPNNERERYLSNDEIKIFWKNIETCTVSNEIKRALKLILVTAQRPSEVIGIHTDEIEGRWWNIPSNRTKNKRPHSIYLTDLALRLIGDTLVEDEHTGERKPKGYIFPSPHIAKNCSIAEHALPSAVRKGMLKVPVLDKKGNAMYDKEGNPVTENLIGIEHFTPHDLRRTANTMMASSGIPFEHRERVMNHKREKLDRIYNRFDYADEKQIALEAVERQLLAIINGKSSGKVIAFAKQS